MKKYNKDEFLVLAKNVLGEQIDGFNSLEPISVKNFAPEKTVLIVMDMINGFAKEGALFSPRIMALIPEIKKAIQLCINLGIPVIALADNHPNESPEFKRYPRHCISESRESEIVDEFRGLCKVIGKNSTNGYLEDEFQEWLKGHSDINTFILVGDCTDICISQFALTVQADFDRKNKDSQVIVLTHGVETFDIPGIHDGDFYQVLGLIYMASNGVQLATTLNQEKTFLTS